jgi:DNA-binding ferritin-like protein
MEPREIVNRFDWKPQDIKVYLKSGSERHQRGQIVTVLSNLLASTYVLSSKTFSIHWNAGGALKPGLRSFFREQADELFAAVGEITARIRMLGWEIPETKPMNSHPGSNREIDDISLLIGELIKNHEIIVSFIQSNLPYVMEAGDEPTNLLMHERMRKHKENTGALRELLGKPEMQEKKLDFRGSPNEPAFINLA